MGNPTSKLNGVSKSRSRSNSTSSTSSRSRSNSILKSKHRSNSSPVSRARSNSKAKPRSNTHSSVLSNGNGGAKGKAPHQDDELITTNILLQSSNESPSSCIPFKHAHPHQQPSHDIQPLTDPSSPIKHIFVVMLENHSFDNIFAMSGIKGLICATPEDYNTYNKTKYNVRKGAPQRMTTDPPHEFLDVVEQLSGQGALYFAGKPYPKINNSGFASNYATSNTENTGLPDPGAIDDVMACFTPDEIPVLSELANQFAICDQWFSSLPGPTWPNRYFVHGASSSGLDQSPTNKELVNWETVGFQYGAKGSIFDALSRAGKTHRLYNDCFDSFSDGPIKPVIGAIPQVIAISGVHHCSVHPLMEFAKDLQKDYTAQYTFIEPHYGDITTFACGSSQHPMDEMYGGEGLLKYVYESIRNSPVWESSLLIITYDEHGGFYDSQIPPSAPAPGDSPPINYNQYGFTFEQLGVRVPAVVVSPYIAKNTVDHTVYDHSSVLATVERLCGIGPLTQRDAHANNVLHLVSPTLRKDCPTSLPNPVRLKEPREPFSHAKMLLKDLEPIQDQSNLVGFLKNALKIDIELFGGDEQAKKAETAIKIAKVNALKTRGEAKEYIESVLKKSEMVRSLVHDYPSPIASGPSSNNSAATDHTN